jgi:hypothetical protein
MKLIVCEGKHDAEFIKAVIDQHFGCPNCVVSDEGYGRRTRGYKKLQELLLHNFDYTSKTFSVIVYGDNGRQTLINKVIPHLAFDLFRKVTVQILVVVDDDGAQHTQIVESIKCSISRKFGNLARVSVVTTKIEILSRATNDKMIIECFFIPRSLEIQVVEAFIPLIPKKKAQKLHGLSPHEAVNKIAEFLGVKMIELFRKVVEDGLLTDKDWYSNFKRKIESFLF